MHHALEIRDILDTIFSTFAPNTDPLNGETVAPDLTALARTCRTFNGPALDILWRKLVGTAPLARCLPGASCYRAEQQVYSFTRSLTQKEWDTLQSYTRRIRFLMRFHRGLDWESVKTFLKPPTTVPLFPNLRILQCGYTEKTMTLLRLPLPSLLHLYARFEFDDPNEFLDSPRSLPKSCPNITGFSFRTNQSGIVFNEFTSDCICRWKDLQRVTCSEAALDIDALIHLSRMPRLTRLEFALSDTLPISDKSLIFLRLRNMTINSKFLEPAAQFLCHTRLPAMMIFRTVVDSRPAGRDLTSFLASLPSSNSGHTIEILELIQYDRFRVDDTRADRLEARPLGFEDLRPCLVFSNLRHLELNIECNVDLTDFRVLTLASAWPKLKYLKINMQWGWGNSRGGITPGGLVQLLQICRSLSYICLRLNTQGYTEVPPSQVPMNLGLSFPANLAINVLDSTIAIQSVTAIVTFFSGIAACTPSRLYLDRGLNMPMMSDEDAERWDRVIDLFHDTVP